MALGIAAALLTAESAGACDAARYEYTRRVEDTPTRPPIGDPSISAVSYAYTVVYPTYAPVVSYGTGMRSRLERSWEIVGYQDVTRDVWVEPLPVYAHFFYFHWNFFTGGVTRSCPIGRTLDPHNGSCYGHSYTGQSFLWHRNRGCGSDSGCLEVWFTVPGYTTTETVSEPVWGWRDTLVFETYTDYDTPIYGTPVRTRPASGAYLAGEEREGYRGPVEATAAHVAALGALRVEDVRYSYTETGSGCINPS